jgi:hypothetical protein
MESLYPPTTSWQRASPGWTLQQRRGFAIVSVRELAVVDPVGLKPVPAAEPVVADTGHRCRATRRSRTCGLTASTARFGSRHGSVSVAARPALRLANTTAVWPIHSRA